MCSEAIILAGGTGTRLKGVVPDRPKPMADIGGKPFLEYLLNYLSGNQITRVILSVGFKADQIKSHFGNRFKNMDICYVVEDIPLGTGGGILKSAERVTGNHAFIVNGDTLFNIDLKRLADFHRQKGASLTIALKRMEDASRYGSIEVNETGRINAFREKETGISNAFINGGTYIISKKILLNSGLPEKFSFEKDFLEKKYIQEDFFGLEFDNYFIDIGIPSTYQQAQTDFLDKFS
ncbi:nucleotidyltransferase family protein [Mariniphaga sediminis]|uniref:nucleotidyltransferase family protein n=1 Tax=Mariniphaga sediminis TaxID=1628158 RepID=UPI003562E59D